MNRVRCLIVGFLALFIYASPSPAEITCISTGVYTDGKIATYAVTAADSVEINKTSKTIAPIGLRYRNATVKYWYLAIVGFNSDTHSWVTLTTAEYPVLSSWSPSSDFTMTSVTSPATPLAISQPDGCVPKVCDDQDSDSDGVCNSCDQLPGQPDKKHCIWNQSYTADGRIGFMEIDQSGNCDGSNLASRKNSQLDSETQYFDISDNHEEINSPTCAGDDGTGSCKCDYNSSVPSALSPTSDSVDPKTQDELDKLPEDSNCAEIKAACESACLKYGGTKTNSCTSSGGKNHASCSCLDSTTINTRTDDNTSNTGSTGGNSSSTGGQDSNSDGKDDTYAAVKDAINDSGIGSKINNTNSLLNGIGNSLNSILNSLKDGETSGSASLPNHNNYDSSVDELQEESFGEAIINFMSSGLPLVDFIRGTGINNGSGESSLNLSIFGSEISLDFSPYSDLLEWVGLILVFIASIIAFRIITNS